MNIATFFGNVLSEKTGLKVVPCAGLIRLSIKKAGKTPENVSFLELKSIFQKEFKEKLKGIGIDDVQGIIKHMVTELIKNQSLFTMSAR